MYETVAGKRPLELLKKKREREKKTQKKVGGPSHANVKYSMRCRREKDKIMTAKNSNSPDGSYLFIFNV